MSDGPQHRFQSLAQMHLMDLLAVREHSEKELRTKLLRKLGKLATEDEEDALEEAITAAIAHAYQQRWLAPPEELAAKTAEKLHQKNKGIQYINTYLETKGLPPVAQESELELEKARALVKNKYSDFTDVSPEERMKLQGRMARFLASKGFDSEVVRKVIYEKFGD